MSRRNVSWSTCLGDKRLVSEWRRAVFRKRRRCIAESRPRGTCLVGSVGSTVELGSRSSHWRVRSSEKKSPRAPSQFGESTVGKKTLPPVLQCAMHGIVGKSILRACAFSPPTTLALTGWAVQREIFASQAMEKASLRPQFSPPNSPLVGYLSLSVVLFSPSTGTTTHAIHSTNKANSRNFL